MLLCLMQDINYFKRGPCVQVCLVPSTTILFAAKLLPSASFCFTFHLLLPQSLKEMILDWGVKYSEGTHLSPTFLPKQTLSPFSQNVLQSLLAVPFGKTRTYQELALASGSPKGARAAGSFCAKNPFPLFIPCHRILAKSAIGEFAFGVDLKKNLLDFENNLALQAHKYRSFNQLKLCE
jgi:O-6-methylguanine DNA methyltransferase